MAPRDRNILKDIMNYCAKTEHSAQEVRNKLRDWKVRDEEMEEILEVLQREKFLDEARLVEGFVREKWSLNQWGKTKIKFNLLQKGIAINVIEMALSRIDQDEYEKQIHAVLDNKWYQLHHEVSAATARKITSFGWSRGYEEDVVSKWIESHLNLLNE